MSWKAEERKMRFMPFEQLFRIPADTMLRAAIAEIEWLLETNCPPK